MRPWPVAVTALFAAGASAGTIPTPGVAVPPGATRVVKVASLPNPGESEAEGPNEKEPAGGIWKQGVSMIVRNR